MRALALLLVVGCTQTQLPSPMPDLGPPDMATPVQIVPLQIGPIPLNPGQEKTVCSVFKLPNANPIDVIQINATLAPGSHHLVLYKSKATLEKVPPFDCPPLDISKGDVPVFIAETEANNSMPLPKGAAYHFEAGQMVKLEAHYLNATNQSVDGLGKVNLSVPLQPGTYQLADIMFCGSVLALSSQLGTGVPPGDTTLPPGFYKPPAGVKVFALTTHQHKRGALMTLDKSTSSTPGTNLTMGQPYDNPPFVTYDDDHLVTFKPNEGFRWQCQYHNPNNKTYYFGQSAEDNEMCFFWAYYYPSVGKFISDFDCWQ